MVHQITTFDGKILVELKLINNGTEFYTSNELTTLKQRITEANQEHGLQFENDFIFLNGIKKETINDKFTEISERWGLKYVKMERDTSWDDPQLSDGDMPIRQQNAFKNTFPDIEIQKEVEPQTQLEELNDYLKMLSDMDKIGIRRKIVLLEGYIHKLKNNIK
jgi:hypothetical protein